jgi:hypothetical protein
LSALHEKRKREASASREQTKQRWLGEIGEALDVVTTAAEELDQALAAVRAAYQKLVDAELKVFKRPNHDFMPAAERIAHLQVRSGLAREIDRLPDLRAADQARSTKDLLLRALARTPIPIPHDEQGEAEAA